MCGRLTNGNTEAWKSYTGPRNANGTPAFLDETWDPAALLNPRNPAPALPQSARSGYGNPNSHTRPHIQQQQQPAPMFHFASPSDNGSVSYAYPNGSFNGNGHQNGYSNGGPVMGMGSMLERQHGVVERDMYAQVPKRRKVEQEDSGKMQFNGGGGQNGVLGTYMKEQRDAGRKEASANGTKAPTIALLDDDDDVVILENPGDKEVCYGRVEGAEINTHKVPCPKPSSTNISTGNNWPQVRLQLRRRVGDKTTVIHVYDGTRELIGCVDTNTSIALVPLLDANFKIRTSGRILSRPKKVGDPQPGESVSLRYPLDLNIYGPRKHALQIGRHLSQKNVWLRTPIFAEKELYNPHIIERPPPPPPRSIGSRPSGPVRTTEEIRNDVLNVFDTLERSENLAEMEPNHRITTDLLRHQKQGLYFMTGKEKPRVFGTRDDGDDKGNSSLWRLNIGPNGQKSYYNVITGQTEEHDPPQVLGGILADMMGLGKTLSILSLVTKTLDVEAEEWAQLDPHESRDNRELCPMRKGKGKTALPKIEQASLVMNCKTTLLVSPLSVIANWEEQIKQHIKPG